MPPDDKLSGAWNVDFNIRIGLQKYTMTFDRHGTNLTGRAHVDAVERTREVEFRDVRLDAETISFWEPLDLGGNEIRIEFSGRISDNSITFTRTVGEFSNETVVAKRADVAEEKAEAAPAEKAPPAATNNVQPSQQLPVAMANELDPNFHIYLCFGQSNMESGGHMNDADCNVEERFLVMADFDNAGRGDEQTAR